MTRRSFFTKLVACATAPFAVNAAPKIHSIKMEWPLAAIDPAFNWEESGFPTMWIMRRHNYGDWS